MSTPSSPRQPEWQPTRVPKLAYRKAMSPDEMENFQSEQRESARSQMPIQRSDSLYSTATKSTLPSASMAPPKKKNFLGGLFAKEPTLLALAQVEADLKAKHGAATAQKVPHVSSRKMPEHVPKVNAKWDGIPEVVKQREREEKQRRRTSQRTSMFPLTNGQLVNSTDLTDESSTGPRRPSDTGSVDEMWYNQQGTPYGGNRAAPGQSVSSADSLKSSLRNTSSYQSQSLRSPSGSSLPEITSFFPHHENTIPSSTQGRWQNKRDTNAQPKHLGPRSPSDVSSSNGLTSSWGETADNSASVRSNTRGFSSVGSADDAGLEVVYGSGKQVAHDTEKQVVPDSGKQTAGVRSFSRMDAKRAVQPNKLVAVDAFLAGEARPLQLDGDDDEDGEDDEVETIRVSAPPPKQYNQPLTTRNKVEATARNEGVRRRQVLGLNSATVADVVPWEASELPNTSRPNARSPYQDQSRSNKLPKKSGSLR